MIFLIILTFQLKKGHSFRADTTKFVLNKDILDLWTKLAISISLAPQIHSLNFTYYLTFHCKVCWTNNLPPLPFKTNQAEEKNLPAFISEAVLLPKSEKEKKIKQNNNKRAFFQQCYLSTSLLAFVLFSVHSRTPTEAGLTVLLETLAQKSRPYLNEYKINYFLCHSFMTKPNYRSCNRQSPK